VAPVFYAFRVMIGTGVLMLIVGFVGVGLMWRRGVENLPKPFLYATLGMTFSGWLATLAGWYTTEIGRQPWLVTGVLSTKDAVSDVAAGMVLSSLLTYLAIYALLIAAYVTVIFQLARKASKGEVLGDGPRRPNAMPIAAE
jgi:cytochrome d ubiquinol oxidase subunit I